MDNDFVKHSFEEAEKLREEKEAQAWADFAKEADDFGHKLSFNIAVSMTIGKDNFIKLLKAVEDAGLTDVLLKYHLFSMMRGFKGGYNAGIMSMLEK